MGGGMGGVGGVAWGACGFGGKGFGKGMGRGSAWGKGDWYSCHGGSVGPQGGHGSPVGKAFGAEVDQGGIGWHGASPGSKPPLAKLQNDFAKAAPLDNGADNAGGQDGGPADDDAAMRKAMADRAAKAKMAANAGGGAVVAKAGKAVAKASGKAVAKASGKAVAKASSKAVAKAVGKAKAKATVLPKGKAKSAPMGRPDAKPLKVNLSDVLVKVHARKCSQEAFGCRGWAKGNKFAQEQTDDDGVIKATRSACHKIAIEFLGEIEPLISRAV